MIAPISLSGQGSVLFWRMFRILGLGVSGRTGYWVVSALAVVTVPMVSHAQPEPVGMRYRLRRISLIDPGWDLVYHRSDVVFERANNV
ncbi:hypothetical protein [Acidipropionibacterium acidipropionici]|uniref:hypothetical protein n=1 Tax=Acidipropionibacterium acidipropionici TaxID=1748 RepID=UPI000F7ED9ED|nr:hypothetical protein [Acidipropionibacterium acidipropionici]